MRRQKYFLPILSSSTSYGTAIVLAIAIARWQWSALYIYTIGFIGVLFATISAIVVEQKHQEEIEKTSRQIQLDAATTYQEYIRTNRIQCEKVIINELERIAKTFVPNSKVRSNIFLVDQSDNKLYIAYHYGMNNAPDLTIRLDPLQGNAGDAWYHGEIKVADLSNSVDEQLRETWKMKYDQISVSRHLKAILAIPLKHPKNQEQVIAVLNIDSTEPIANIFNQSNIQERGEHFALIIASLLWLGNVIERM